MIWCQILEIRKINYLSLSSGVVALAALRSYSDQGFDIPGAQYSDTLVGQEFLYSKAYPF